MKMVASLAIFLASVAVAVSEVNDSSLVLVQRRASAKIASAIEAPAGGNDKCKCVNIDVGDAKASIGDEMVQYPAKIGKSCSAWDDGVYPDSCVTDEQSPGLGKGWCKDEWCYVDPCNCDIEVSPKTSAYFPDVTHNGHQLYYSYATCGASDSWTAENHGEACVNADSETKCSKMSKCAWVSGKCLGKELANDCKAPAGGNDKCKCVNIDVGDAKASIGDEMVQYPASIGKSCSAWDDGVYPDSCVTDEQSPGLGKGWCKDAWCYVDPCNCDIEVSPKTSAYFPDVTHNGHQLYYSYATCGASDSWTTENHGEACVNADSETTCSKMSKCAWVSGKCLGKELANDCKVDEQ